LTIIYIQLLKQPTGGIPKSYFEERNMKKILFTTAYSMSSKNTWQYTLKLAHYFQAQISLMHVYEDASSSLSKDSEFFDNRLIDSLDSFDEERYQEEQNRLTSFANKHTPHINQSVPMDYIVTIGNIAEAILKEEQENKYDLIVLGTKVGHQLTDRIFGSTSLKVLKRATTPVFLVPPMAQYARINKIVYITNFELSDLSSVAQLMEWVSAFKAEFHLLHVSQRASLTQQAMEKMEKLKLRLETEYEAESLAFKVLEGKLLENVETYLDFVDADMMALTNHKQGFFTQLIDPDLQNQLAAKTIVPLLTFKQTATSS